jgi:hypothetical protein
LALPRQLRRVLVGSAPHQPVDSSENGVWVLYPRDTIRAHYKI